MLIIYFYLKFKLIYNKNMKFKKFEIKPKYYLNNNILLKLKLNLNLNFLILFLNYLIFRNSSFNIFNVIHDKLFYKKKYKKKVKIN